MAAATALIKTLPWELLYATDEAIKSKKKKKPHKPSPDRDQDYDKVTRLFIYLINWPNLWHVEVSGPGIEPVSQQ